MGIASQSNAQFYGFPSKNMKDILHNSILKSAIPSALLIGLVWLGYWVLREFFLVLTWAILIVYITWPVYLKLKLRFDHHSTALSAGIMTGIISTLIGVMIYWMISVLQNEVKAAYQLLSYYFSNPPQQVPERLRAIPWLGGVLQDYLDQFTADKAGMKAQLLTWARQWLGEFGRFLGGIGRYLVQIIFVLITLFFCFRDGEQALAQMRIGTHYFLGQYQSVYLQAAGDTARAVVYGLVLAALGQGFIAGAGYYFAGIHTPVLFGILTALLALVPMGATLVWVPMSLGLIATGQIWHGAGLLIWGILAISTVDNVIRPLVISGAGRIPFLVVLFGVFGGLTAFGVVGLFLGPVILSVLLAVWKAWLKHQPSSTADTRNEIG